MVWRLSNANRSDKEIETEDGVGKFIQETTEGQGLSGAHCHNPQMTGLAWNENATKINNKMYYSLNIYYEQAPVCDLSMHELI